jgi:hypothetical protein
MTENIGRDKNNKQIINNLKSLSFIHPNQDYQTLPKAVRRDLDSFCLVFYRLSMEI